MMAVLFGYIWPIAKWALFLGAVWFVITIIDELTGLDIAGFIKRTVKGIGYVIGVIFAIIVWCVVLALVSYATDIPAEDILMSGCVVGLAGGIVYKYAEARKKIAAHREHRTELQALYDGYAQRIYGQARRFEEADGNALQITRLHKQIAGALQRVTFLEAQLAAGRPEARSEASHSPAGGDRDDVISELYGEA